MLSEVLGVFPPSLEEGRLTVITIKGPSSQECMTPPSPIWVLLKRSGVTSSAIQTVY